MDEALSVIAKSEKLTEIFLIVMTKHYESSPDPKLLERINFLKESRSK